MVMKLIYKNKKGISGVIVAVIMVALVLTATVIVWAVVNNVIEGQLGSVESCFGSYDKVKINSMYTCWDATNSEFYFSIEIKDIEVDSVVIGISGEAETKSFTITNEEQTISGLKNYDGTTSVKLPEKNAGKTYITDSFSSKPDSIKIAPVVDRQQCEESDGVSEIDNCDVLA